MAHKFEKKIRRLRLRPTFEEAAIEILRKAKKPMHYRTITDEVLKRRPLGGKTLYKTGYSVLFRSEHVTAAGNGMFALKIQQRRWSGSIGGPSERTLK